MSGKSQLRVQRGKAGVRWTRGCRLLGNTSLTFLPQQGASGFFADHFGDGGMEADVMFWSGSEQLQHSSRRRVQWQMLGKSGKDVWQIFKDRRRRRRRVW